jgi:hypothetical protein
LVCEIAKITNILESRLGLLVKAAINAPNAPNAKNLVWESKKPGVG